MFYVYIKCTIYDICQNIYTYTHMYTHKHTWKILLRKSQNKLWVIFQELIIHEVIQNVPSQISLALSCVVATLGEFGHSENLRTGSVPGFSLQAGQWPSSTLHMSKL